MRDIVTYDRKRLTSELFLRGRVVLLFLAAWMVWWQGNGGTVFFNGWFFQILVPLGIIYAWVNSAWKAYRAKEFISPKMRRLWEQCQERLNAFHKGLREVRKAGVANYQELPHTVDAVANSLYLALRRADLVMREIGKSESVTPPPMAVPVSDRQANELYQIADRNLAEYRSNFGSVIASVQRTEAQGAVFITTLDNLRLKLLGHRLAPGKPEVDVKEFLYALTEAKQQLAAIDQALEELELMPQPKTITILADPAPMPPEVEERHLKGGG